MLDILEFNASLYSALEKEKKDKEIILNYGKHLAHARSESNIELQIANWIAQFKGITQGDEFNKTPEGSKRICEQLIPECAKLIRRANKKGADAEQISQLKNARSFLDSVLEEANKAISSKSYNQNAPSYARHSEEDDEGLQHKNGYKYLYITDKGRYVYPEDLKRKREGKAVLAPKADLMKAGENNRQVQIAKKEHEQNLRSLKDAKSNQELDAATEKIRKNAAAKEMMRSIVSADKANKQAKVETARKDQQARAYDNNKAAADAEKLRNQSNSTVGKEKIAKNLETNYQNNRKAEEAQAMRNQQNSTIGKQKADKQKEQQYQNNAEASKHEGDRFKQFGKYKPISGTSLSPSASKNYTPEEINQMYRDGKIDFEAASKMLTEYGQNKQDQMKNSYNENTSKMQNDFKDAAKEIQDRGNQAMDQTKDAMNKMTTEWNNSYDEFEKKKKKNTETAVNVFKKASGMFFHSVMDDSYPEGYKGMTADEFLAHSSAFQEPMVNQPT